MCYDCSEDEKDIETYRERIRFWEFKIGVARADLKEAVRNLDDARKELKRRLRKGEIRNA